MNHSIQILYPSYESTTSTTVLKTDHILISANLKEKLHKAHPLPNPNLIIPMCKELFPEVVCMMDYSFDEAILLYRKLFYSTFELAPRYCNINSLLDHIDKWTLNSTPVIIDYGGAFKTKHLHLIQYAFPQAKIYSIDTLYEELDLLVCNINQDQTKWCIIPVFCHTGELNQYELIECVRQELQGSLSWWNGIEIFELEFSLRVDHLQVYDPYSEILGLKTINFIDTTEKCEIIPCCLFMAHSTHDATPHVEWLKPIGLIDRVHTKFDMDYARGRLNFKLTLGKHNETATTTNSSSNKWDNVHAHLDELKSILPEIIKIFPSPSIRLNNWLDIHMISKLLDGKLSKNFEKCNFDDPIAKLFGITDTFLSFVECLNLSSFIAQSGIEVLTSCNVRQLIEQHVGGFWKNDDINVQNYLKNFVKAGA